MELDDGSAFTLYAICIGVYDIDDGVFQFVQNAKVLIPVFS